MLGLCAATLTAARPMPMLQPLSVLLSSVTDAADAAQGKPLKLPITVPGIGAIEIVITHPGKLPAAHQPTSSTPTSPAASNTATPSSTPIDLSAVVLSDPSTFPASVRAAADKLHVAAVAAEPKVTAQVKALAKAAGGTMWGLEFRIKSLDSTARKIATKMLADRNLTLEGAAASINDVLRYTIVLPEEAYTAGVLSVLDSMGSNPRVELVSVKNYWKNQKSSGYAAIHVLVKEVVEGPGGGPAPITWELQLHTPASIDAKQKSHPIYEKARMLEKGSSEYQKLMGESAALWGAAKMPAGVSERVGALLQRGGKVRAVAAPDGASNGGVKAPADEDSEP